MPGKLFPFSFPQKVLNTDKFKSIKKLESLIEPIEDLKRQKSHGQSFKKWRRDTEVAIECIFGKDGRHLKDFEEIRFSLIGFSTSTPDYEHEKAYKWGLDTAKTVLSSFIDEINEYWNDEEPPESNGETMHILRSICTRFHWVARQLRNRHANRPTLEIEDEYDVQDLFHALLKLYFDDIRVEEWAPSYAGACSRVDFLLKQEQVVVEIKKSRKGLSAKEIGDQLLIDIQRYKIHPACNKLICFVYDPEGRIRNPKGLENDLSKEIDGVAVQVYIYPK